MNGLRCLTSSKYFVGDRRSPLMGFGKCFVLLYVRKKVEFASSVNYFWSFGSVRFNHSGEFGLSETRTYVPLSPLHLLRQSS
jgi:hypothetical protein